MATVLRKLLGRLNRIWSRDPEPFLGLRLRYDGAMTWRVADGVLTTATSGGSGAPLNLDLASYTLATLASALAVLPGYSVLDLVAGDRANLSALVLLEGRGDPALSNGDHLFAFEALHVGILATAGEQLRAARATVIRAPAMMATTTAEGEWLDEIGGYYGVRRIIGETDAGYSPRIPAEALRPRANNVALEMAIEAFTGHPVVCNDAPIYSSPVPAYNASITYNAGHNHDASAIPLYGLFDVTAVYDDTTGLDATAIEAAIRGIIERSRAAGTQLRTLIVTSDTGPRYNGFRRYNNTLSHNGS